MKIISFFLALTLSVNVFAQSLPVASLERSLDEYQYALTVEWDQKDEAAFKRATEIFYADLSTLTTQGMTREDIITAVEKKIADRNVVEAIKLRLGLLTSVSSSEELITILKDETRKMYLKGASWNGDVVTYGLIAAGVLAVGFAIWFYSTHECNSYNTAYTCSNTSEVYGTQCYYYEYCEFYKKKDE